MKKYFNSKNLINIIIAFISLFIGGLSYIVFHPNSYISVFLGIDVIINREASSLVDIFYTITCYSSDFFWALSFCCILCCFLTKKQSGLIVFSFGVIWEALQMVGLVSGTADIIDVFAYLVAVLSVIKVNQFIEDRNKTI